MNVEQRLFLVQAKSAFAVYQVLNADSSLHHCHALHYLQMATELLGKASAWKNGPTRKTHKSLVPFLRSLASNSKAQDRLGYSGQNEKWSHSIRKSIPIAENLQKLAPALSDDGPNAEYPWPVDAPTFTPSEFDFPIRKELAETSHGRFFIVILHKLFAGAENYL